MKGGDGDDWLLGDYARQYSAYDTDLPVIFDVFRAMEADPSTGVKTPGPFGSLFLGPIRLMPNDIDDLMPVYRTLSSAMGTVALPGILRDMRNMQQVCHESPTLCAKLLNTLAFL